MKPKISAVINTYNEEKNIYFAISSLKDLASEIIVVDMYSEDKTCEISESLGAKVYMHNRLGFVEPARSFALSKTSGDWIIILDADEFMPRNACNRLLQIAESDEADVVTIPRMNYIAGKRFVATGWGNYQDQHMRFFKKGKLETSNTIHGSFHPASNARMLLLSKEYHILHFNYTGFAQVIEKLNRYTTIEAETMHRNGIRPSYLRGFYFFCKELLARYVKHKGYRDNWQGLYMSVYMAFYKLATETKLRQIYEAGSDEEIERKYTMLRKNLLSEIQEGY
jgi:glycosyltransferase involved in cell wall biosynthesis